jgi:hypothetical protein
LNQFFSIKLGERANSKASENDPTKTNLAKKFARRKEARESSEENQSHLVGVRRESRPFWPAN